MKVKVIASEETLAKYNLTGKTKTGDTIEVRTFSGDTYSFDVETPKGTESWLIGKEFTEKIEEPVEITLTKAELRIIINSVQGERQITSHRLDGESYSDWSKYYDQLVAIENKLEKYK